MKKLFLVLLLSLFLATGCGNSMTPTGAVEDFLGKYQSMDSDVLAQLDKVVSDDTTMSDDQKKEYKSLMEKQYQYLSYKVTNEDIVGDTATVDVEIEVFDYATSIRKSDEYYEQNKDMFDDENKNSTDKETTNNNANEDKSDKESANNNDKDKENNVDNNASHEGNVATDDGNIVTQTKKYIDYKIEQMKTVTDKVKYTITFNLSKKDNMWVVDDISDIDRQKIHGLFDE